MWGIASESFGSTYTKNDYLGKKGVESRPSWSWMRLRCQMSVGFADFAGFGAAGLGRRNLGDGFRDSC